MNQSPHPQEERKKLGESRLAQLPLRWVSLLLLGVFTLACLGQLYHQRRELVEAKEVVDEFELSSLLTPGHEDLEKIHSVACRAPHEPGSTLFVSQEKKLAQQFVEQVRENILLPSLRDSLWQEQSQLRGLYTLALLYASHNNSIGQLVRDHLEVWAVEVELPPNFISSYLDMAARPWPETLTLELLQRVDAHLPQSEERVWENFFSRLRLASQHPEQAADIFQSIQESASELLIKSAAIRKDELAHAIYAELQEVPQSQAALFFDESLAFTDWVEAHRDEVTGLLQLIQKTQRESRPLAEGALKGLADELERIEKGKEEGASSSRSQGKRDAQENWPWLMAHTRSNWVVEEFLKGKKEGSSHLIVAADSLFDGLSWKGECESCPLFTGEVHIPGRLTKVAVEQELIPTVHRLTHLMEALPLHPHVKEQLAALTLQSIDAYAEEYRKQYSDALGAFQTEAQTVSRLRQLLAQAQDQQATPLDDLLELVGSQTNFSHYQPYFLEPLRKKTEEFAFTRELTQERGREPRPLLHYAALIGEVEAALAHRAAPSRQGEEPGLEGKLSGAAREVYRIWRDAPSSHWNQVVSWAEKQGIPPAYQEPFLEPLHRLLDVGLPELAAALEELWHEELLPQVTPLFHKFPFNQEAQEEVSVAEMTEALGPGSAFWSQAESLVTPFCAAGGRCFHTLSVKGHPLVLPPQMMCVLQGLNGIRSTLWDREGRPQALTLSVKPVPLSGLQCSGERSCVSVLHAGQQSVYSVSDSPHWQSLQVEWWKNQGAAVGMQLVSSGQASQEEQAYSVDPSTWSFLRLLQQAQERDEGVWTWDFYPDGQGEQASQPLPFEVKGSGWELFKLNCVELPAR